MNKSELVGISFLLAQARVDNNKKRIAELTKIIIDDVPAKHINLIYNLSKEFETAIKKLYDCIS